MRHAQCHGESYHSNRKIRDVQFLNPTQQHVHTLGSFNVVSLCLYNFSFAVGALDNSIGTCRGSLRAVVTAAPAKRCLSNEPGFLLIMCVPMCLFQILVKH